MAELFFVSPTVNNAAVMLAVRANCSIEDALTMMREVAHDADVTIQEVAAALAAASMGKGAARMTNPRLRRSLLRVVNRVRSNLTQLRPRTAR